MLCIQWAHNGRMLTLVGDIHSVKSAYNHLTIDQNVTNLKVTPVWGGPELDPLGGFMSVKTS